MGELYVSLIFFRDIKVKHPKMAKNSPYNSQMAGLPNMGLLPCMVLSVSILAHLCSCTVGSYVSLSVRVIRKKSKGHVGQGHAA